MLIPVDDGVAGQEPVPLAAFPLSKTLSELSHRLHQHLSLAQDAQASNRALQALLERASAASGASGFAGVTQQLVETNKNLQNYTAIVGEAIGTAVEAFQDLETTVQDFEREFVLLRERVDAIRKSTKQVAAIALQSRMVALNASIEAAHIGAAGAGFNVVAQEVRDLSTKTADISNTVQEDLLAVERPLEYTTRRFEENQQMLARAKAAIEGLDTTARSMLQEAEALSEATENVEAIAFKQVEIQDHLDGIDRFSQWIGQAADALVPELVQTSGGVDGLWEFSLPADQRRTVTDLAHFENELYQAIRADEPHRARHAVEGAIRSALDRQELINRISQAATRNHLDQLGRDLPTETVFRNARILEDALGALEDQAEEAEVKASASSPGARAPIVVLGNAFEDHHDLGRRLVAMRMRAAGFTVVDLGLSVSNETFVDAARTHHADIVGVSALLLHTAVWIPRLKADLKHAGLAHVRVIAGGAPFLVNPKLRDQFGADGVASNPNEAVRLVSALMHQQSGGHRS